MDKFVAYRLNFLCQTTTPMELPHYKGSVLRGAFFGALRHDFCLNKASTSCLSCSSAEVCPICKLVATVDRQSSRGAEIPRPFALQPIISETTFYQAGDIFLFGITLFGQALPLFPYVILAISRMGEYGLGNRPKVPGCFFLRESWIHNPLTGMKKCIYHQDDKTVSVPDIAITNLDVENYAASLPEDHVQLNLMTPLRLVVEGRLVQKLSFRMLMQRILRRLTDLYRHFCHEELDLDFAGLLKKADQVKVAEDKTHWLDLYSYSRRRRKSTPISGLVGEISFQGELDSFLPFLVWGQFTHVGKDVTRGNGWYRIAGN